MERPHSAVPSKIYEKLGEGGKKRQRPKTAEPSKNGGGPDGLSTPPTRFVKAQTKQSNSKHKFFRSRKEKERDNVPPPMGSLSASTHQLHKEIKPTSQPSFFNMRYKSLTNLAHQEYDTLDSSNSGGKTSFDSAGSRHVPEKRSRKLSRPKSLTNLVWDLRGGGGGGGPMQRSSSKPSLLMHQEPTVPG